MIYTDGTHLVGTHEEELHLFANSIGLKRQWFQDEGGKHPHYDTLSGSTKHRAIAAGAVLVPSKKIIEMFRLLEERKKLIDKIDRVNDSFLSYGYVKQLEPIDKQLNNLHL